jgi:hypothetical protein
VDNSGGGQARWAVRTVETALAAAAGVLLLALTAYTDAPGRILGVAAGLGLLALAGSDLVWRPRLAVDEGGLSVHTPGRRLRLPWDRVTDIRVDQRQHLGLTNRTLEIDAGDKLVVLGRRSLGTDPREVAATLATLRR